MNFLKSINIKNGNIGYKPTIEANIVNNNPWAEDIKNELNFTNEEFDGGVADSSAAGVLPHVILTTAGSTIDLLTEPLSVLQDKSFEDTLPTAAGDDTSVADTKCG